MFAPTVTSTQKVVQPQMLIAENMANMELREIVQESCSLMNKCKRQLLPFFLCIYIPVAVMYTFIIRLHHDHVEHMFQSFIIMWKQQHQFPQPASPLPPTEPVVVSNTQLLIDSILFVAFMIGYYHMITSTILTLCALHKSGKNSADRSAEDQDQPGEPFSAKRIVAMLPSRTWRLFVTDAVCFVAYMGIIFLMLLAVLVLAGLAMTVLDFDVAYTSLVLELYLFTVWMIYFVVNITLVAQVSAVEHVWGWAAVKRSAALLRGKKMTAISVLIFQTVCAYSIYIVQATLLLGPPWTLPIAFALDVGLATLMFWFSITITTVLYFSCKATHNERGLALPVFATKSGPPLVYEPLSSS